MHFACRAPVSNGFCRHAFAHVPDEIVDIDRLADETVDQPDLVASAPRRVGRGGDDDDAAENFRPAPLQVTKNLEAVPDRQEKVEDDRREIFLRDLAHRRLSVDGAVRRDRIPRKDRLQEKLGGVVVFDDKDPATAHLPEPERAIIALLHPK